ncbi:MAG: hypothetical protein OXI88_13895 [Gammaproteobacteria bacterium]|nr:hypothetical protein [Gammaproteobacteria bacterium]MDE0512870.1 hypothetical protein [Gammaproteobacteria bacterium]
MFRATQRRQDKAQPAGNGESLPRAATPYWRRCVAPFGRAGKRSPRRCAAWQGLAIPGTARLALNRFPTR